jgi:hypothetical protein
MQKNGINNIYMGLFSWQPFMELKMVKIWPYFHKSLWVTKKKLFQFFVLKVFDYEISKRAIIHMDFIKHFSKYYDYFHQNT